jgi:hypothetical protein
VLVQAAGVGRQAGAGFSGDLVRVHGSKVLALARQSLAH